MAAQSRPMKPADVRECTEVIAAHPVIGPRYRNAIKELHAAWLALLRCQAHKTRVFQIGEGPRAPICFVGVSVFVNDEFVREIKTPPGFWFGPELARRISGGPSPVLSDVQLREANSREGLNLLVWEGCMRPEFAQENRRTVMAAFIEAHRGYLWKEMIGLQVEGAERLHWSLQSGTLLWDFDRGQYADYAGDDPDRIVRSPHVIGVTREIELSRGRGGSWVGRLFDYEQPRFGFSHSEQRLLLAAIADESGTDQMLADTLALALPTIKKTWRSVYQKAADRHPDLIPEGACDGSSGRGKEKRRRLLAYIREHPEELRPVSRKLLERPSAMLARVIRS
jgi:hypothetical protein